MTWYLDPQILQHVDIGSDQIGRLSGGSLSTHGTKRVSTRNGVQQSRRGFRPVASSMVPVSALSRYSRGLALPLRMLRKLPIVTLAAAAYELWLYKFPGQEEHFLETEGWTKQDCFRDVLGAPKGGFPNCAGFYDWDILPDLPFWRTGYFYINFPSVKFQPNTPYQYPALRFFKQAPETPTPPMPEYVPQTDPFFISALKPDVERRQLPDWQPDWLPFIDPESLPLLRPSPFPEVIPFRELPHRRTNRWRVRRYRREVGPQPSARPRELVSRQSSLLVPRGP